MLNKMFLIAAAFLLLVLQSSSATTTESDTIWTKNLPYYIKGCAFSLTGDSIISIAGEGGGDSLFILDAATGKTLKSIKCKAWVWTYGGFVHFNKKSWVAISIDADFGGLYIYDYLKDSIVNEKFGFLGKAIAITKDDKYIYVQNNSSSIKNISIYDVEKGEVIDSISSSYGTAHSLAISPDNKYLAIGTGKLKRVYPPEYPYEEDRMFDKIVIINLEKKEIIKEFDGPTGTEGEIRELKFSPDGKYLGVAKLDGNLYIYQMDNMELYRKFNVYKFSKDYGPWVISFTRNSQYIICGVNTLDYYTGLFDIKNNILLKSIKLYTTTGIDAATKDRILISNFGTILLLSKNILTGVKENIEVSNDSINTTIIKSLNSPFTYKNSELVKSIKLYDYNGNIIIINSEKIAKVNFDIITFNAENLPLGIYFLVINENKTIKILVTE